MAEDRDETERDEERERGEELDGLTTHPRDVARAGSGRGVLPPT